MERAVLTQDAITNFVLIRFVPISPEVTAEQSQPLHHANCVFLFVCLSVYIHVN